MLGRLLTKSLSLKLSPLLHRNFAVAKTIKVKLPVNDSYNLENWPELPTEISVTTDQCVKYLREMLIMRRIQSQPLNS